MRRLVFTLAAVAILAPRLGVASDGGADEEREAWRYRRGVSLVASQAGPPDFAALAIPPEVGARCQPDLRDLRLLGADGHEIQYVLDRALERAVIPLWTGRLVDTQREKRVRTAWVVDLGEPRTFDRLNLDIREQDFAKRVRIEASDDGRTWRTLVEDAGLFDHPWGGGRIHHTTIPLPERVGARQLRITADDRGRSQPVDLLGVVVSAARRVAGEEWRRPAVLTRIRTEEGVSRYGIDLPPGFPLETLVLAADDPAFSRHVALLEVRERNGRKEEVTLGEGVLYRVRIPDESLSGEWLELPVRTRPLGGELLLDVRDGDSPPLRNPRGIATAAATRLIFPALPGALALYYGNEATRAPLYDIEALKGRLGVSPALAASALGPEVENPRFRRSLPIPASAPRGATVDLPRWRALRPVAVTGREDLYTLTLAPADLALLRPDLGDLRIVDEAERQVPCIVEPAVAEARVDLGVAREAGAAARPNVSRYRLTVPQGPAGRPDPLPLSAVEVAFREGFFSRPGRLLAPAPPGTRGGERVLFSGLFSRSGTGGGDLLILPLDGTRASELRLEVDEGDNAPLTLVTARGVVRVPRLAFKAGPSAYRVLLGNPQAEPPRYDIASLRREILSYSAVVVEAGATTPNPAYRRRAGDYFKEAPPTVLLWGTLLGAVVALLALTARILKQPRAE